jgi:hypothetical protein
MLDHTKVKQDENADDNYVDPPIANTNVVRNESRINTLHEMKKVRLRDDYLKRKADAQNEIIKTLAQRNPLP